MLQWDYLLLSICRNNIILKFQGYNGSQLWDTAFTVQAIISTKLVEEFGPTLRKAHSYIKHSQVNSELSFIPFVYVSSSMEIISVLILPLKVLEDCEGNLDSWYRHISKGAWPFSTADHGWPISDCTAEGLKVRYSIWRAF